MNDSISRQAAIDAVLGQPPEPHYPSWYAEQLKKLPPAEPERKKGKWIDEPVYKQTMDGKTWDGYTYCSECKEMHEYGYRSKFCPNCSADMRPDNAPLTDDDSIYG